MSLAEEAIILIVRSINAWLKAAGNDDVKVKASDIQVLERDGKFILAFEIDKGVRR